MPPAKYNIIVYHVNTGGAKMVEQQKRSGEE